MTNATNSKSRALPKSRGQVEMEAAAAKQRAAAPAQPAAPAQAEPEQTEAPAEANARIVKIDPAKPFLIDGKSIATIEARPLMFAEMARCYRTAMAAPNDDERTKLLMRAEMQASLIARDAGGSVVKMDATALQSIPARYSAPIRAALRAAIVDQDAKPGEVTREGDGYDTSIVFTLGTPIKTGSDGKTIDELEFQVRTVGDLEDFLAAAGVYSQTVALIRTCARPIGADVTLLALPTWAVDQITIADGIAISAAISSRFM